MHFLVLYVAYCTQLRSFILLCILFAEKQSEPLAKESESGQAEEDGDADPGPPGVDDESDSTKEEKKEEQNEESDSSEDEAEHKREIEKRKGLGAYLAMMRSESKLSLSNFCKAILILGFLVQLFINIGPFSPYCFHFISDYCSVYTESFCCMLQGTHLCFTFTVVCTR